MSNLFKKLTYIDLLRAGRLSQVIILGLVVANSLVSCTSTGSFEENTTDSLGMSKGLEGYVPAKTAVLPCRPWPNQARYPRLPLANLNKEATELLCNNFDKSVIESFTNQPYVKGYSPSFVSKTLESKEQSSLIENIGTTWSPTEETHLANLHLTNIRGPVDYYRSVVEPRPDWRAHLEELANSVKGVDAVLLPLLISATSQERDERGILVYERTASVVALLINTVSGELIWTGRRQASASRQYFKGQSEVELPDWQLVAKRLFVNSLWRDYPGRVES